MYIITPTKKGNPYLPLYSYANWTYLCHSQVLVIFYRDWCYTLSDFYLLLVWIDLEYQNQNVMYHFQFWNIQFKYAANCTICNAYKIKQYYLTPWQFSTMYFVLLQRYYSWLQSTLHSLSSQNKPKCSWKYGTYYRIIIL